MAPQPLPFLEKFCPELRNRIYEFALDESHPIIDCDNKSRKQENDQQATESALESTNKPDTAMAEGGDDDDDDSINDPDFVPDEFESSDDDSDIDEDVHLSAEDRDDMAITCTCGIDITTHQEPALIQTCSQIREECLLMYYNVNTFCFVTRTNDKKGLRPLVKWLRAIGPTKRAVLTKLHIVIGVHNGIMMFRPHRKQDPWSRLIEEFPEFANSGLKVEISHQLCANAIGWVDTMEGLVSQYIRTLRQYHYFPGKGMLPNRPYVDLDYLEDCMLCSWYTMVRESGVNASRRLAASYWGAIDRVQEADRQAKIRGEYVESSDE